MANDSIYLMSGEELVEMRNQPYESEDLLQELLAKHPDLLAGSQINADVPRRWLLVRRELGVPGGEGEASRFSLDHLFIDQDAIPTLVEVKRSTDTRLRREVVWQMLDYATNGSKYWPPDSLEAGVKARCAVHVTTTVVHTAATRLPRATQSSSAHSVISRGNGFELVSFSLNATSWFTTPVA